MNQSQQQNNFDGFESQIEQDEQELETLNNCKQYNDPMNENRLPPGISISNKKYSLYPDIATGWSCGGKFAHPIPITVDAPFFDKLIHYLLAKKINGCDVCYLGPRYDNTFYAWYQMPFDFPYAHLDPPVGMKFTNRPFVGQNPDYKESLIFDSFFENGNLDCAIQIGQFEYDLYLRVDSNTRGHFQWFNFKAKNMVQNETYKFNICNLQKDQSLYMRGMKPYVLSKKGKQSFGMEWSQQGSNIKYQKKTSKSLSYFEPKNKNFYNLSFQISTKYINDQLHISYSIPYTLSDLHKYLQKSKKKFSQKRFYHQTILCKSLGGLPLSLITVTQDLNEDTNSANNKQRKIKKKCVIITARVHPGQPNSSFVLQGFLNYLCSGHKHARYLRNNIVFKIVPMLNPDGVCFGNYRTGLNGRDFNRDYQNPSSKISPQVYNIKKLVIEQKKKFGTNFFMYIDLHGHATKKNCFMYGPQYSLTERMYYQSRVFPRLLSKQTKIFRYYSCIFKIQQEKKFTSRVIFYRSLDIPLSYTFQASNYSYYDTDQLKDIIFDRAGWENMGGQLVIAMSSYLSLVKAMESLRIQNYQKRHKSSKIKNDRNNRTTKLLQRKKQKRKVTNTKIQDFSYGRIIEDKFLDEEQDLMRYIYQQIQNTEQQKKLARQKNLKQNFLEDDFFSQKDSDYERSSNDLDPCSIQELYKCIRNKRLLSEQSEQHKQLKPQYQKKSTLKENFVFEPKVVETKHRRAKSAIGSYRNPNSRRQLKQRQPNKIYLGNQLNQDLYKNSQYNDPQNIKLSKSLYREKQKPKTFEQFINLTKSIQKSLKNKSIKQKNLSTFSTIECAPKFNASQISTRKPLSPKSRLRPPPQTKQTVISVLEKKKMQIYRNIQISKNIEQGDEAKISPKRMLYSPIKNRQFLLKSSFN